MSRPQLHWRQYPEGGPVDGAPRSTPLADQAAVHDANAQHNGRVLAPAVALDRRHDLETDDLVNIGHHTLLGLSPRQLTYELHLRRYLCPYLGQIPLAELTLGQVEAMYAAIATTPDRTGLPPRPTTVRCIHATLMSALNFAVRWSAIRPPMSSSLIPSVRG